MCESELGSSCRKAEEKVIGSKKYEVEERRKGIVEQRGWISRDEQQYVILSMDEKKNIRLKIF